MVLVTSANGNVGRRIISSLCKKGIRVKAMDISPQTNELLDLGVEEVMIGDLNSSEDLNNALSNCDQLLYIPTMFSYIESQMAIKAFDAAIAGGIRQIVFLSVTHPNMSTLLQHTQKLKSEEYLIYKGLSHHINYTILQPMHYNHNFPVQDVWNNNAYTCFYSKTTKLSYVDCYDVGEAAGIVLTEDGHQNATYELVNSDFLSPADMVEIFNRITGRHADVNQIDVEDFLKIIDNKDSYYQETFRRLADTYSRYGIAGNPNVLTWLLGRKPTSFEEYVKNELKALGLIA